MKSVIDSGPGPLIHRSRSRPFLQAMAATNRARHPSGSRSGDGNEDTGLLRQLRFLAKMAIFITGRYWTATCHITLTHVLALSAAQLE